MSLKSFLVALFITATVATLTGTLVSKGRVLERITESTSHMPRDTNRLAPDVSKEWRDLESFFLTRSEFSHYQNVKIRQVSARPFEEETKICIGMRYGTPVNETDSSVVCFIMPGENRYHFTVTQLLDPASETLHYNGQSYNKNSVDNQLYELFSLYGEGLLHLAVATI